LLPNGSPVSIALAVAHRGRGYKSHLGIVVRGSTEGEIVRARLFPCAYCLCGCLGLKGMIDTEEILPNGA